jgi:hypothetical protein
MIYYLRHHEIDKDKWDNCIRSSVNRRVYAFSWYLDHVCPGWDALVEEAYISVMPLTHYHKWGIQYLAQPYFAQQLGVFSCNDLSEQLVTEFIQAIPCRFRFVEIQLNSGNRFAVKAGEGDIRMNYELTLPDTCEEITRNYSQNTRRNIRKALESDITQNRATDAGELIRLFRENFGKKEGKLKERHYNALHKLISYCLENNMGYILCSKTKAGSLSAGVFFLFDQSRVYFLFAASSPDARENGSMFLLIDRFIAENAGKNLILDFEGGNDPDLGRFYKSFGAAGAPYPVLRINRLPKVVGHVLYFVRKLRK